MKTHYLIIVDFFYLFVNIFVMSDSLYAILIYWYFNESTYILSCSNKTCQTQKMSIAGLDLRWRHKINDFPTNQEGYSWFVWQLQQHRTLICQHNERATQSKDPRPPLITSQKGVFNGVVHFPAATFCRFIFDNSSDNGLHIERTLLYFAK